MGARKNTDAPKLTRDRIVATAMRHADAHTLAALTMRDLADELGVSPMSLYRHVSDKDDVLLAVTDAYLARNSVVDDGSDDWAGLLRQVATTLRKILRDQPTLTALYGRIPVATPAAVERLTIAATVLGRCGFDEDDAVRAYAAVHTYTVGFSLLEMGRAGGARRRDGDDDRARTIAGFVSDEQFEFGLHATLAGIPGPNPGAGPQP